MDADQISFLIGGGSHPGKTGIRLLIGGQEVRTATGNNSPHLELKTWDVSELRGKPAQLEIFDNYSDGDWGHIFVDNIMLGGKSPQARPERALWVDYGRDFYAATSWSNIPSRDGRRIALGWMSNWEYAQDVPTSPWRNAMTVPRVWSLTQTPDGPRLVQEPVKELQNLRKESVKFPGGSFAEATAWLAKQKKLPPAMDVEMTFADFASKGPVTLRINTGQGEQTSVTCDPVRGRLAVDRTRSGNTGFHPGFSGRYEAPLRQTGDSCTLRLLLDASSLEIFAQNGETVLSNLIFPAGGDRSLRLSADGEHPPSVSTITIHEMSSIWRMP